MLRLSNISEIALIAMELKTIQGMRKLLASCPKCQRFTLYGGKIILKINALNSKEVLCCKNCRFVLPMAEYKKILFTE